MIQIKETLRHSLLLEALDDSEVDILWPLLNVRDVSRGEMITQPSDAHADTLFILVRGRIEVCIESEAGVHSIFVMKPGDLAGIITFSGRSMAAIKVTALALEATRVLSLNRIQFESLIYTHPHLMYRFYLGMVRHTHRMLRHFNQVTEELSEQISPRLQ
jgi:CRP-like cAMP-binding protein